MMVTPSQRRRIDVTRFERLAADRCLVGTRMERLATRVGLDAAAVRTQIGSWQSNEFALERLTLFRFACCCSFLFRLEML